MKSYIFGIIMVLAMTFFLVACGVKSPPQPARFMLPDTVRDLKYQFNEEGLLKITFRAPSKNRLSKPLKRIGGFYLESSEDQLVPGFCPGCPITYTRRVEIAAMDDGDLTTGLDRTYTHIEKLAPGNVYHYRVFTFDKKGRYEKQAFRGLVIYYDSPSRAPDNIEFKTDDQLVSLFWPPPDKLVDGRALTGLSGYDIYRRTSETEWAKLNTDQPWPRPSYDDRQVKNNKVYYYRIKALRRWHGTWIESASTPVIKATPVDLTPPPPPAKLETASVKSGISLRWQAVELSDLAGYRVYRMAKGEAGFSRIGPALITASSFLDEAVKPGLEYTYKVTALDNADIANESEPGHEKTITYVP